MITVSAPGKIHLMGEHAVVYGKPAILAAVNMRLAVAVEKSNTTTIQPKEVKDVVMYAMNVVKNHYTLDVMPSLRITVTSDIPFGFHLGSSAALSVAAVGATMYSLKKIWNPQLINELAYEVEKKNHGNPSGGDNTAVTFGGFIWFRKELEFLKSIWQLPFKFPKSLDHFFLIDTGKPKETTAEMVAIVKSKVQMSKSQMEKLFDENEAQTKRITIAIKEGNEKELIDAVKIGEQTLESMGVVSKKVVPLIRKIEQAGGVAKILGGGGKKEGVGFLLCYHDEPKAIAKLANPYGYTIRTILLGEEGVRLDNR